MTLETRGSIVNSTYCDAEGRFGFYNLVSNPYHVIVEDEGYQRFEEVVAVNPIVTQTNLVHIILTPVAKPKREEGSAGPVLGGNPYAVSAASYAKKFPREATKEYDAGVRSDEQGRTDEAMRHYQRAIELAPGFYPAHNNLGAKYLSKGDLKRAEDEFARAIKLDPDDAQAYFNLGNVFYVTKRYEAALRALEEGLKRQPNAALGLYLLGCVDSRVGKFSDAERSLRSALELNPSMPQAHLELVNLYLQQQRNNEAIGELRSFVKLYPRDPRLPKVKEVLKKLETRTRASP